MFLYGLGVAAETLGDFFVGPALIDKARNKACLLQGWPLQDARNMSKPYIRLDCGVVAIRVNLNLDSPNRPENALGQL
jgi:hypothetical protein